MKTNAATTNHRKSQSRLKPEVKDDLKSMPIREFKIAVYWVFMTPLSWGWALFVWDYVLVWLLVNDRLKLLVYRVFDPSAVPLLEKQPLLNH